MVNEEDISAYNKERNAALSKLDMSWLTRMMMECGASPLDHTPKEWEELCLASAHKARYEIPAIDIELRRESRRWLESHGYTRQRGIPWPEKDENA